jgi:hypothetical protein
MIPPQPFFPPIRHQTLYMTPTSLLITNAPRLYAHLVPAFVTLLALGGQVGLPILVLTCLRFKRVNRHSTFVNCCITSIIYSLVFCILLSRFPVYTALRHSDFKSHSTRFQRELGDIEYIRGNIGVRCQIMHFVLLRHLWSWPFSRCTFPQSSFARKQN